MLSCDLCACMNAPLFSFAYEIQHKYSIQHTQERAYPHYPINALGHILSSCVNTSLGSV